MENYIKKNYNIYNDDNNNDYNDTNDYNNRLYYADNSLVNNKRTKRTTITTRNGEDQNIIDINNINSFNSTNHNNNNNDGINNVLPYYMNLNKMFDIRFSTNKNLTRNGRTVSNIDDSIVLFRGRIDFSLENILQSFRSIVLPGVVNQRNNNADYLIKLEKYNKQYIHLYLPKNLDISNMFNRDTFLSNFNIAFNKSLNATIKKFFTFKDVDVNFIVTNIGEVTHNLTHENIYYFRLLTCILFGFIYDIQLSTCSCYPQTISEFLLFKANISFNCIKQDCKLRLISYPNEIDFINYSECSENNIQITNTNLKLLSNNINLELNLNNFKKNLNKLLNV